MTKQMSLNKLISLTFDEDPSIRKQAAQQLSHYDDPSATFALLELSYDKNEDVSGLARGLLEKKKKDQPQLLSFADVFSAGAEKKEEKKEKKKIPETKKEKMLKPLEELFEKKLGKGEKAEMVKSKMMPTLEKIYIKAVERNGGSGEERGRAVQAMLTKYLDRVASGPDEIIAEDAIIVDEAEPAAGEAPQGGTIEAELQQIGTKELDLRSAGRELEEVESRDLEVPEGESPKEPEPEVPEAHGTQTVFKYAFDTMMASEGDEKVLKSAMKGMMRKAEQDIKLAFKIAKSKYKNRNIVHLTELKSGMRNIHTLPLNIKAVEHKEYPRTKTKKDTFTRVVVSDNEGNEGVVYLFEGRGAHVKPGMQMKVEKGFAKTFDFSNETALTVSKKGTVYIVL